MKGRSIDRPNRGQIQIDENVDAPSMKGRSIDRPNQRRARLRLHPDRPSMKGRSIDRPNTVIEDDGFVLDDLQ